MGFFALFLIELESILSMGGRRGACCISSTRLQNYADYQAWSLSEAMRDTYGRVDLGTGALWEHCDRAAIVPPALDILGDILLLGDILITRHILINRGYPITRGYPY